MEDTFSQTPFMANDLVFRNKTGHNLYTTIYKIVLLELVFVHGSVEYKLIHLERNHPCKWLHYPK